MPRSRVEPEDIFKESNMLLLTKSLFFQDTTRIAGSHFAKSIRRVEPRFFGYVYRCVDEEDVPYLFANGIFPNLYNLESGRYRNDTGTGTRGLKSGIEYYGIVLRDISTPLNLETTPCIDTYICHYQARRSHPSFSLACLLDIRELGGIVHSEPWLRRYTDDEVFDRFPITKKIDEVLVMYPVSESRIVGVIKDFPFSNISQHSQQLKLYVNPNYTGGMEGAMAVAASFNGESFYGESEWEMVDA